MIETPDGLDNVEDIAATPGLDALFVGPFDLGLAIGATPGAVSSDPVLIEALAHIRRSAHDQGKRVGIFCGGGGPAALMVHQGFDFVVPGHDGLHLATGAQMEFDAVRRAVEEVGAK